MKLTKKQFEVLKLLEDDKTEEIIFGGGAGGAKSFIGCYWLLKNCLKYPGTRWLMGRAKLKTLKETTLVSFLKVCKLQGVMNGEHFIINHSSNTIKFFNGSEILMKDLFYYPSDPQFDELGSLEITGAFIDEVNQIVELAWVIVNTRIRHMLDEYNLTPKMLGTCNPSKNWVYKNFYKKNKEGNLDSNKRFIQSLVHDNPFISKHYIKKLEASPKQQRDRLLYGKWEIDDSNSLIDYDNIVNIFSNNFIHDSGKKYITCDVARLGSDKAVICVWSDLKVIEVYEFDKSRINELQELILSLKKTHSIGNNNIVIDADGVGGGLVDILGSGVKEFNNNAKALKDENYQNLKTQCYYKLAEYIQANKIWISAKLSTKQQEEIIEELEQIKSVPNDMDNKLKILSKTEVKANIGRSPDYSDALMMRMFFEFSKSGVYAFGSV